MAEVREHYTHMTDEGASVKGEGASTAFDRRKTTSLGAPQI